MSKSEKAVKPAKDPEGRMALAEHLRELRNRLVKSLLAIIAITIVAFFYHRQITDFLIAPLPTCGPDGKPLPGDVNCALVSNIGLLSPFTVLLKVALTTGVVVSTPVWLYQLWKFVAPGLHQNERRYTLSFLALGTPLFLAGAALAYVIMPVTAQMLISLTASGVTSILPVENYLDIITRMVLVFGLGFEFPLLLVMLNLVGVVSGKRLLGWWRGMVMAITVFAAFATPSADPLSMLGLAAPIIALYFVAVGVALLNDRRRARRNPDAGLDEDEASHLDLSVDSVGAAESIEASPAPELPTAVPAARREQLDDIT
ncbi:twin-arginine translocase subunit TatC [Kitasatospora sp. CMC57]|uniref:Sec-independent protein translocase protein TatC n=2 Tax=Kitasatospora sp. CMC57 TaxID=3231513 RepID=A0AB33JRH3_9ACTN